MMNLPEKEFSQLSNEEAKEQLLSILPEDEKTELETYDIFYFDRRGEGNWEISEGNPKVWMLRGKRVVPDIARGENASGKRIKLQIQCEPSCFCNIPC